MNWIRENWKKLAKYGGVGVGCLSLLLGGFVLVRYVNSGETYESPMVNLVPEGVSMVLTIDNVPKRNRELDGFLTELAESEDFQRFERTGIWKDLMGSETDPEPITVDEIKSAKKLELDNASKSVSSQLGSELFVDLLYGELIVATDSATDIEKPDSVLALQRVSRTIRFKWQFLDFASLGFPDNLDFEDGILSIQSNSGSVAYLSLLGDVLAFSNSSRLIGGAISIYNGEGRSLANKPRFRESNNLLEPEDKKGYAASIWVDLDRVRSRVPAKKQPDGSLKHPIDTFNTLPVSVVSIFPEIFTPLNRIVTMNLDTQLYDTAVYGIDITDTSQVKFDQFLVVNQERADWPQFEYMIKTLNVRPSLASHLKLLPAGTMLATSYAQEFDVVFNDVLDESARASFVGDFLVALNSESVQKLSSSQSKEMVFAALPADFGPDKIDNIPGTHVPIPPFEMAFRLEGAQPEIAREMLENYLLAQRGRVKKKAKEANAPVKTGAVSVIQKTIAGQEIYALHDPRKEENIVRRINRSIRATLIGEWLILTNTEKALEYAIKAERGRASAPISDTPAFGELPSYESATLYVNFSAFVDYFGNGGLFKTMRENKYNPDMLEGRDPGEVRREIAESFGLDPSKTESLLDRQVTNEYNRRKAVWQQTCKIEGNKYEAELREDIRGLKFFKDLSLVTQFEGDYLKVSGILRLSR